MQCPRVYIEAIRTLNALSSSAFFSPLLFGCVPTCISEDTNGNENSLWNKDIPPQESPVVTLDHLLVGASKLASKSDIEESEQYGSVVRDVKESLDPEAAREKMDHLLEEHLAGVVTLTAKSLKECSVEFQRIKSKWSKTKDSESSNSVTSDEDKVTSDQERF